MIVNDVTIIHNDLLVTKVKRHILKEIVPVLWKEMEVLRKKAGEITFTLLLLLNNMQCPFQTTIGVAMSPFFEKKKKKMTITPN